MSLSFTAGQLITANELNLLVPLFARKASDQSVTNSATLVNDNDITFSLVANQTYMIELHGIGVSTTSNAPGIIIQWTLGGTLTGLGRNSIGPSGPAINTLANKTTARFEASTTGGGSGTFYGVDLTNLTSFYDIIVVSSGASGGTVTLQWAQAVATTSTTTTLKTGTFAVARVVA